MQDCVRGILFNDKLIYILTKRTQTAMVHCKNSKGQKQVLFNENGGCICSMYLVIPFFFKFHWLADGNMWEWGNGNCSRLRVVEFISLLYIEQFL